MSAKAQELKIPVADPPDLMMPDKRLTAWLALLAMIVLVLYSGVLNDLVSQWWTDPDYGYGFLVPVFAGSVIWLQRSRYTSIGLTPSRSGLALMLLAISVLIVGTLGNDFFMSRISFCILLTGMVVFLCGWKMLRALAFPLGYLSLMIPLPGIIHSQVTFPMQLLASRLAEHLIGIFGLPVFREGNLLRVPYYSVEVATACSGIRSLLSLVALGVAYAYVAERRPWVRLVLIAAMFPVAIATNALRIMTSCLLGYKFGPEWAEGFLHFFSGWLIFVVSLCLLYAIHSCIKPNWGSGRAVHV